MGRLTLLGAGYQPSTGGGGGHLYDFTTGSLPANVTASGGANGQAVNSSGDVASATAPRFDYLTGASTILVEDVRTNAQINSTTMNNNANWVQLQLASTSTETLKGVVLAVLTEDTTTNNHGIGAVSGKRPLSTSGQSVNWSVFLAAGTRRYVRCNITESALLSYAVVDTQTWTITETGHTSSVAPTATLVNYGGGLYRLECRTDPWNATQVNCQFWGSNSATPGTSTPSYLGNSSTIRVGGCQVELNVAGVSSYMPTSTTAVTRTADLITLDTPATFTTMRVTYSDDTTEDFTVTPSSTYDLVPASLNLPRVKYADAV